MLSGCRRLVDDLQSMGSWASWRNTRTHHNYNLYQIVCASVHFSGTFVPSTKNCTDADWPAHDSFHPTDGDARAPLSGPAGARPDPGSRLRTPAHACFVSIVWVSSCWVAGGAVGGV